MAHGTPDWNRTAGITTTFQLNDLGEAVVRLGSIVTHDRRGDVIWLDSLESGFQKWEISLGGTGAAAAISQARARNGASSVLLTGGSDVNQSVTLVHDLPLPVSGRLGAEGSFNHDSTIEKVEIAVLVYDGTNVTTFRAGWSETDSEVIYLSAPATFTAIATGVALPQSATLFNSLKLVLDTSLGEYVRVILNQTTYSLSGISGVSNADASNPHQRVLIILTSREGQNDIAYVDDIIITQNEP